MSNTVTKTYTDKTEVLVNRVFPDSSFKTERDMLAIEEPVEIRLGYFDGKKFIHKAISITMRTPGNDFELAAGFLFTEGIIKSPDEIKKIKYCGSLKYPQNTVRVDLEKDVKIDFKKLERHFYTTSSCGVCGKSSIEALNTGSCPIRGGNSIRVKGTVFHRLPEKLRRAQNVFEETGGLHAAGLFDFNGNLIEIREDVGRHNAVDKLIGSQFLANRVPLTENILMLSGRASFELVQKAVMAQIPIIAAVSAPSSLAVEAAEEFNVTLLGFVRNRKFNVYTGNKRIINET